MKIVPAENGFYKLVGAPKKVTSFVWSYQPQAYRFFSNGCWYVHEKLLEDVKRLAAAVSTPSPEPSLTSDYAALHLLSSAPVSVVKAAYKALALEHHPDRGGDPETFSKITAAYTKLTEG